MVFPALDPITAVALRLHGALGQAEDGGGQPGRNHWTRLDEDRRHLACPDDSALLSQAQS